VKKSFFQNHQMIGLLCGAAALAAAALAPQSAHAGTAQNAKILNVVTVTYYDAGGLTQHQAATSTSVLVALKQAPLNVTTIKPFQTVDSGLPTTSYVALTATANGQDTYKVNFSDTMSNLSNSPHTVGTNITTDTTGSNAGAIATGGTVQLGATSIVSVDAPSGTTQKVYIPGGTLNTITTGSIVVINSVSYTVTGTSAGSAASYDQTGTQTATGTLTPEVLGYIILGQNSTDGELAPSLSGSVAGTIIGERKFLQITDTATVNSLTLPGTDSFSVSTDTTSGGNTAALVSSDVATFNYVALNITKTVSSNTGKPGDVLEYTVTVVNTSPGNASKVVITDTVPAYTTLVSGSSYGSGTAGNIFATIYDSTNTVNVTLDPTDSETQPGGAGAITGFGGTVGGAVTAGTGISFYLGTGASNNAGGNIAPTKTYTIKYQVKIN